ncbi:MAG: response regulator transcription factor [Fimbriimonadaceae bacterium]|nr:response regulator transcription factor [Chitinophagales bacterium]
MMKKKILYVEDELNLGTIVSETLGQKGFDVLLIKDGAKVMESFKIFTPDICVLDVMLPHKDGYEIGKEIRIRYESLPIIFLTAKTQTQDVVKGFSSGGTDYIRKPFSVDELVVRIHNQLQLQLKNKINTHADVILLGKIKFIPKKFELHLASGIIKLSNREAEVLTVFAKHINETVDRKKLLLEVWGDDSFFHSRNLDVYISKLREYFTADAGIEIITLKGKGYQFVVG